MYRDNNSNPWIVSRNQKDLISLKLQFYCNKVIVRNRNIYLFNVFDEFKNETFQSPIKTYPCLQFLGTSRK